MWNIFIMSCTKIDRNNTNGKRHFQHIRQHVIFSLVVEECNYKYYNRQWIDKRMESGKYFK